MGFLDDGLGDLAPADQAMFENEALATSMAGSVGAAFQRGFDGYAEDVSAQGRAWSFDPGRITAPVLVVHGEADTLVPLAHARHNTELVTTARLVTRPGHGHLSLLLEIPQLVDDVVAPLRPT